MDGRAYILNAIELLEGIVQEIDASSILKGNPVLMETKRAMETLANLKNRATLRTRAGTNLAYPVHEASKAIEEAWSEARGWGGDPNDLRQRMEEFITAVEALEGALRERTVIMT